MRATRRYASARAANVADILKFGKADVSWVHGLGAAELAHILLVGGRTEVSLLGGNPAAGGTAVDILRSFSHERLLSVFGEFPHKP